MKKGHGTANLLVSASEFPLGVKITAFPFSVIPLLNLQNKTRENQQG
jgi:hypothetical protein